MMSTFLVSLLLLTSAVYSRKKYASCPCTNVSLCDHVTTNFSKELYGFVGGSKSLINDTTIYNWTYITALAIKWDFINQTGLDQLMCEAHKNNVRMIYRIEPSTQIWTNDTNKQIAWAQNVLGMIQ